MNKFPVSSLSPARYAETFHVFVAHSLEYPQMLEELARIIRNRFHRPYRLLDIGAGTGMLLRALVEKTGLVPARYTAFEPNPAHVAPLRRVVSELGLSPDVRALPFSEHTPLDHAYDLVLFSHSLYWMADPARVMLHAASAVVDGGLTLAFIGGPYGVHAMFPLFEPSIERLSPMLQNNAISSHEVVAGLRTQGAKPEVRMLPTPIDLTELFEPERLPELGEFISFCMQIEFTQLPDSLQDDLIGYVRGGCVPHGDRWYWYLPTAALTLER